MEIVKYIDTNNGSSLKIWRSRIDRTVNIMPPLRHYFIAIIYLTSTHSSIGRLSILYSTSRSFTVLVLLRTTRWQMVSSTGNKNTVP